MAYIDFIKADYSDKSEEDAKKYIERDKENLGQIIQTKISKDISNIVDRWYELDEVGLITVNEKFIDLLKEAEQLYAMGFYTGTVAISGIAAEEYSKYLYHSNIGGTDNLKQYKRISVLRSNNVIDEQTRCSLDTIRLIRNDCMHYDVSFKSLSEENLRNKALTILTEYKKVLSSIAVKRPEKAYEEDFVHAGIKDSLHQFTQKYRNMLSKRGIDIQMPPGIEYQIRQSLYFVGEIDTDTEHFKEITLFDALQTPLPLPVVVDFTLPQAQEIDDRNIKEGNLIVAKLMSAVDTNGITSSWILLKVDEIYRCHLSVDEFGLIYDSLLSQ